MEVDKTTPTLEDRARSARFKREGHCPGKVEKDTQTFENTEVKASRKGLFNIESSSRKCSIQRRTHAAHAARKTPRPTCPSSEQRARARHVTHTGPGVETPRQAQREQTWASPEEWKKILQGSTTTRRLKEQISPAIAGRARSARSQGGARKSGEKQSDFREKRR